MKALILATVMFITAQCKQLSINHDDRRKMVDMLQKQKEQSSITTISPKIFNLTTDACVKLQRQLSPNSKLSENTTEALAALCQPCSINPYSSWCINCCKSVIDKRKPLASSS